MLKKLQKNVDADKLSCKIGIPECLLSKEDEKQHHRYQDHKAAQCGNDKCGKWYVSCGVDVGQKDIEACKQNTQSKCS